MLCAKRERFVLAGDLHGVSEDQYRMDTEWWRCWYGS